MTSELEKGSMDIDSPGGSNASPCGPHGNGLTLYPVSVNDSGEGLPYAPEDFPNPGDKWRWKVGKRIAISGYFLDRYMYLPRRLRQPGHRKGFASRLSLEQYVREKFPNTDIDRFFSSFSWKIPSKQMKKGDKEMFSPPGEILEDNGEPRCKAGNKFCSSLASREDSIVQIMFCDICCIEPGFCIDCCCILCCRVIDKASSDDSYIRCEANVEGSTCGHSCHIDCALRAYMAGTVGGSIGLDAEYYCRRCDTKTDLVSYVERLLENCESVASRDGIEKILRVGICVLRGSKKASANELLHHIELAMSKLKDGTYLEHIWKGEDVSADIAGHVRTTKLGPNFLNKLKSIPTVASVERRKARFLAQEQNMFGAGLRLTDTSIKLVKHLSVFYREETEANMQTLAERIAARIAKRAEKKKVEGEGSKRKEPTSVTPTKKKTVTVELPDTPIREMALPSGSQPTTRAPTPPHSPQRSVLPSVSTVLEHPLGINSSRELACYELGEGRAPWWLEYIKAATSTAERIALFPEFIREAADVPFRAWTTDAEGSYNHMGVIERAQCSAALMGQAMDFLLGATCGMIDMERRLETVTRSYS